MRILAVLVSLMFAHSALAAKLVDVYECDFGGSRSALSKEELLPGKLMIINDGTYDYLISDEIIERENGQPIRAKVNRDGRKKLVLEWSMMVKNRRGATVRVVYRLAYFKSSQTAIISAKPTRGKLSYNDRGGCKKKMIQL